jgi:hypothetical protein
MAYRLIDTLRGRGVLKSDGLPDVPVSYVVRVSRQMVDAGGTPVAGLLRAEPSIDTAGPADLFAHMQAGDCELVLSDGLVIGVFIKRWQFGSSHAELSVRDAKALGERYR